ncbi:unannotated protein [freshwater metagenome]|uniref:Unannotated protein n=1 Tax=freshwater metagenome TaxID=449393 RepID=A0A6J7I1E5_9ZZZZ|nr:SDR family NAD(P)-dependent oxidoreductase [Actinomycetota bacterium]
MKRWTAEQVPDQRGRTVVVTGANSGIGLHTAIGLAAAGAQVVLACRDAERGARALAQVSPAATDVAPQLLPLDLASLQSIGAFADALETRFAQVDVLVNNAGVMATPRRETADGFELQFGTNHLGHFALTGALLPLLRAATAPRVVSVASLVHRIGRVDFDDLNAERRYRRWGAYAQSKLANLLFTYELQSRARTAGSPLVALAAHPGYTHTNLQAIAPQMDGRPLKGRVYAAVGSRTGQSAAMGALPTLYAVTMPLRPGAYVGPDGPGEMRGHPRLVSSSRDSKDPVSRRRLWEASERLTDVPVRP